MPHFIFFALTLALQAGGQSSHPPLPATTNALPALAWSDFDGDGHADLLVVHGGTCSLLRGTESGGLVECTSLMGPAIAASAAAAAWTDYDGDGAPDLFLLTREGQGRLLRNEAGVEFIDVTLAAGLTRELRVLRAEWVDHDADGQLDLVLWTPEGLYVNRNRGNGTFESMRLELPVDAIGVQGLRFSAGAGGGLDVVPPGGAPVISLPGSSPGASLPGGTIITAQGPVVSSTQAPQRPPWGAALPQGCASSVLDSATSNCIETSSTPELGKLYPLSPSLNVEFPSGYVGVGTTNPGSQLEVAGTGTTALRATSDKGAAFFSSTSAAGPAVDIRSTSGQAAFMAGRLEIGYVLPPPLPLTVPRVLLGIDAINAGTVEVRNSDNKPTIQMVAEEAAGNGAQLCLAMDDGTETIILDAQLGTVSSKLDMFMSNGVRTVEIMPEEAAGNGAQIVLRKADGTASIVLDAEQGTDGRITTETLEITGGADLVESFDTGSGTCQPGTVVVIDSDRSGQLTPSTGAYDKRVAGVVSGAGGIQPGLHMGQTGVASGSTPVALTGRVYVRCSTENGPIAPGDLLTTSSMPGRAMRATDPERCFGAVIGKAMSPLEGEQGLVLVLVNLQ